MTTRKEQTPTLPILDAVDSLNAAIRKRYPEVPRTTIVLGTSGKSKKGLTYGHFSHDSWSDADTTHEIMISGEALAGGAEVVLGVLLHESAHAIAHTHSITDTSNNGRYHNKKYKIIAEGLGLVPENKPTLGWTGHTLADTTASLYVSQLDKLSQVLNTYRINKNTLPDSPVTPRERNKTKVYIDCECDNPVTVSKIWFESASVHCNICETDFQIKE